jgi:molybdopterin-containing oxidoreductase family iron-sulfur binding subunit
MEPFDATAFLQQPLDVPAPRFGEGEFHLVVYPHPILGDGAGANRPWLQETPEPMTTVMWNSWVEVNPETAHELGLRHDDIVEIRSPYGRVYAAVYVYPGIRPDTVALAFGQGHEALGRWAEGRGANPAKLLGAQTNAAGDLAWGSVRVSLRKTGRRRPLARKEHLVGVYGDGVAQ